MNSRVATLKAMDTIMRNAEDEEVTMCWSAGGVPDDADYEFIASEDEVYYDICECFRRLISAYSHRIFGRPKG